MSIQLPYGVTTADIPIPKSSCSVDGKVQFIYASFTLHPHVKRLQPIACCVTRESLPWVEIERACRRHPPKSNWRNQHAQKTLKMPIPQEDPRQQEKLKPNTVSLEPRRRTCEQRMEDVVSLLARWTPLRLRLVVFSPADLNRFPPFMCFRLQY